MNNYKGRAYFFFYFYFFAPMAFAYHSSPMRSNDYCTLFVLPRLSSLVLKVTHLRCQPEVFPVPRSTHTARAIQAEAPDMREHLEREEATQTGLFSQL